MLSWMHRSTVQEVILIVGGLGFLAGAIVPASTRDVVWPDGAPFRGGTFGLL